jgi:hypothetical protein
VNPTRAAMIPATIVCALASDVRSIYRT